MLLYIFSTNYDWTRRCGDNWSRMQATAWAASAGWQRPRHKDGTCGKRFGWIVLSRITNTESCREKNKLETQPIAQLHSKQTKELRGWGGKCRNWRNATPTFRNGTILVSEYGIELVYTGLWRTTWPHQHLQDTKNATTARINTGLLYAAQTTPAHEKRVLDFDPSGQADTIVKSIIGAVATINQLIINLRMGQCRKQANGKWHISSTSAHRRHRVWMERQDITALDKSK